MTPETKRKFADLGIKMVTSLACDIMAFVFFYLVDWRAAVGYGFVWLADMTHPLQAGITITKEDADALKDEIKRRTP